MEKLNTIYERNKKWLFFSLISVFVWGMMAHGYCFVDNNLSHDSLNEFHAQIFGNEWKIQLGRVFVPLYRDLLRSDVTMPWLIGILSLLWIGLSVFLVVKIFNIKSKLTVFLTAGVFATNISVSAVAATYVNDLDNNMFALLLAVLAVCLWRRMRWGAVLGAVCVAGSLGLYQSYILVAVTLVMIASIMDLFRDAKWQDVFFKGLKAIGMLLAGGVLYYIAMKAIVASSGVKLNSGDYNSLDAALQLSPSNILTLVAGAYQDCCTRLMQAYSTYPSILVKAMTLMMLLLAAAAVLVWLCGKKTGLGEKILGMVLILLLPLGMNLIYVLVIGASHDLMVFALWLFYLLLLLLTEWLVQQWQGMGKKEQLAQCIRVLSLLLVLVTVYGSVQFANGLYMKKELEYDGYFSLMTRIVDRMEDEEGYIPGQTPVVFVGMPSNKNGMIPGFLEYWNVIGAMSTDVIYMPEKTRYQAYFDYVLNTPMLLAEDDPWMTLRDSQLAKEMSPYPAANCIAWQDGTMIVKLG